MSFIRRLIADNRRSKMVVTEYTHDPKERTETTKYLLSHHSSAQRTTLEQYLTISRDGYGHIDISVALDDFPSGLSERESMLKLADWLHRLGVAIEDNWSTP
ncbi:hypothetical protein FEM41_20090 [Jejubacter calystegiae]|uniref:Uncharacterized protein n=1 Tax=Jejubacter calystegiae TaxID=2579935 RepID=A0A4P8YLV6_9ENTR|nr:hypothetical protein [Jejubacter calystegiae]QCT21790.1 hypothetical protein FEM41_20090 [Jejubacter calystegiae]